MATRRAFLVGGGALAGAGIGLWWRPARGAPPALLRPPGARPEPEFLARCLRCNQCGQACPHDVIDLTGLAAGIAASTPFLTPRANPCTMCIAEGELFCAEACPSGALEVPEDWRAIRIGTAVIDAELCLAYNGTMCRACWHACPLPDQAIVLGSRLRPEIRGDVCTGCGLCEHACLTEPTSIQVAPPAGSAS